MPVGYSHTRLSLFSVAPAQFRGGHLLSTTSPALPYHLIHASLSLSMTVLAVIPSRESSRQCADPSLSSWIFCCLFGPKQMNPRSLFTSPAWLLVCLSPMATADGDWILLLMGECTMNPALFQVLSVGCRIFFYFFTLMKRRPALSLCFHPTILI